MANGVSNYLEQKVLEWIFKKTALPAVPTALYVSLHSGDPGDAGANELGATGSYARAQLDPDANNSTNTNWNALDTSGVADKTTNKLDIAFPQASADWNGAAAITKFALWDASSGGNCLWSGSISGAGLVVLSGNTLRFTGGTPGQFAITLD